MRVTILALLSVLPAFAADAPNIETLMKNGHWKRAREAVQANYQAHPNEAHANYLMAVMLQHNDNLNEAIKYAETAVKLDGQSNAANAYHRVLGEALGAQAEKASYFKQIGLARRIRTEFETALALDPKHYENVVNMILYYMEAPGIMGGDKKKARELANALVKSDPSRGYLALARIASMEKETDKLEALYSKAAEANPKNFDARSILAGFYLSDPHTNYALAEQHARAALEINPDAINGYRLLAYSLAAQKRLDEAVKIMARAEVAIPDDLSPYVYVARALLRVGIELPKAESYLKKYLAETKEPESGAPLIAGTHWTLALVYEKQGRKLEATSALETSLRIKPDFEPAKKDLKRIKGT